MKIKIQNRFWIIPNALLVNPNITLKAKGLYWYIQSKPDDWDFSAARIAYETKDGRDGISAGLQELEAFGYLIRQKYKNEKWQWQIEYELLETPHTITENPVWNKEKTTPENPATENPATENPATNKTRNTKKEIQKKIYINNAAINNFILEFIENRKQLKKPMTDLAIKKLVNKCEDWLIKYKDDEIKKFFDRAIESGWQWVFEIKEGAAKNFWKKAPANAYQDQPDSFLDGFTK